MQISTEQHDDVVVVSIVGSLDALTAPQAADFLAAQVPVEQKQWVINLGQVKYMGSTGLRMIMEVMKKGREQGGDVRLAAAQPNVRRILEMSGLLRIMKAYDTVDEAIASFNESG